MRSLKFVLISSSVILLFLVSCNRSTNKSKENKVDEAPSGNPAANPSQNDTDNTANTITKAVDTTGSVQNTNADIILAQGNVRNDWKK